jgi:glycosyltransferase involved in cell wall biosynthesis
MENTKFLSILIPGKNATDYNGSFDRLRLCLTKILSMIQTPEYSDVEVVLCDWGSEEKIVESLGIAPSSQFRCVHVPPDIAAKYNRDANYAIPQPINTACRHSRGKYVLFLDCDIYVTTENFIKIYNFIKNMENTNDESFYWSSRYHIPFDAHANEVDYNKIDEYLATADVSTFRHDLINVQHFYGCGICLLMKREYWVNSTGFWEHLIYWGWQDIEFHHRLATKYNFGGDLQSHDMQFFHLDHHSGNAYAKKMNGHLNSSVFEANGGGWGLADEPVEILE